jgi:GTP-binding protein
MIFVDEIEVAARAGKGGDGVVRWLHLKSQEFSGPAGGNGGDGGDVYIRGVQDINLLSRYRGEKKFEAGDGKEGANRNQAGARGNDFVLDLPVGSVVTNRQTGEVHELVKEGELKLVLKGGRGGAGNTVFKSSVNQSPMECTPGARGENAMLHIELRLIANAGFIGLPNAGKSSLLNALTGAAAKVGAYAFTTLDPNLGAIHGFVLADIPGLIEGASDGKGLGFKFLRHISRTQFLLHCIALESDDPLRDYDIVRKEITEFEHGVLADKPEIIVLTKSDTRDPVEIQRIKELFESKGKEVLIVSVLDDAQLKVFKDALLRALR